MHPLIEMTRFHDVLNTTDVNNYKLNIEDSYLLRDKDSYFLEELETDGDSGKKPSNGNNRKSGAKPKNTKNLKLKIKSGSDDENSDVESKHTPKPDTSRVRETVIGFGFTGNEVNYAVNKIHELGQTVCYENVIEAAMSIRHEWLRMSHLGGACNLPESPVLPSSSENKLEEDIEPETPPEVREQRLEAKRKQYLQEKKLELVAAIERLTYRCKMCNDAEATILLLPCAHLVCCENCLMDVRRCPLPRCNKIVRGTKEVFFA